MAFNLQALSITSAFNSIVAFFRSQENNSRWRNLSNSAEGTFLIRLLSSLFSSISYRLIAQSREVFLSTAALRSSNIGIACSLGVSVFRGSNLKRAVRLLPNGDYVFPKLSVIGTYNEEYDIIVLDEVALKKGEPSDFKVVVGKIKEETFVAGTSAIKIFSLFTENISEDYVLYLGSREVPTTKVIKEMKDDKYLVRTNPYGSVDIAYLNTVSRIGGVAFDPQNKYGTGSEITIRYVELANMEEKPFTSEMFEYGEIVDVTNISSYLPFESIDEIKVNAPLDHEIQNLIRSKADYAGKFRAIIPAVIDTDFEALTPTYTLVSYLKNDLTLLSGTYVTPVNYVDGIKPVEGEIAQVQEVLKEENFFGTPLPDITVPRREVAYLQIDLELNNKYKNKADVDLDVGNIIDTYYNEKLGTTFNVYDLERQIESLSYVRYARVRHKINERSADTNYQLGYILGHEDKYYIASKILGITGSNKPSWNVPMDLKPIDTNRETIDGNIVWRAYKYLPGIEPTKISTWHSNMQCGLGDYVVDPDLPKFMFKCVDLIKTSGSSTPETGFLEKGDFVVDGSIVWVVKDYSETYDPRMNLTNYRLGQSANLSTPYGEYSLECISYTGTAGTDEELEFEDSTYPIINKTSTTFTVRGRKDYYFKEGDIITATHAGGYTPFTVKTVNIEQGNTKITVVQTIDTDIEYQELLTVERGTKDGQILWTLIENIDEIKYNWNSYVTFAHELNILERI